MRPRTVLAAVAALVVLVAAVVAVSRGGAGDATESAAATTTSAPHPSEPSPPEVVSFTIDSPLIDTSSPGGELDDGRTTPMVQVRLPAGYHDDPDASFPVLWLLHGADHGADAWTEGLATYADDLAAVVVTPDAGRYGMYVDWWSDGARADPAWATFHLDTVREQVEQRFRIREGRRWHAIAGVSMGGQGALRYAALLPGYFGSVATFSAAMPDMQSGVAEAQIAGLARGEADYEDVFGPIGGVHAEGTNPRAMAPNLAHTRMFLTSGDGTNCPEDPADPDSIANDTLIETVISGEQAAFVEVMRGAGAEVVATTTCGVHTFGVWNRAFTAALDWGLFEPVDDAPSSWTYRTGAIQGEVWGLPFHLDAPPTEIVTIERAGDTISATGTGTLTLDDGDCRIEERLPFSVELTAACLESLSG